MKFKEFLMESENQQGDVRETLAKIPEKHRKLLHGYKFKFQGSNNLKNDSDHVGYIDEEKKVIMIAAPWRYPREFTLLHEVGHLIWKYFVTPQMKKEWSKIYKNTKDKQHQGEQEIFCMAYANSYSKNKIKIHDHPEWEKFIKRC